VGACCTPTLEAARANNFERGYMPKKTAPAAAGNAVAAPAKPVGEKDIRFWQKDTRKAPWRWICLLVPGTSPDSLDLKGYATGWLAGPRLVVTAGHVINDLKDEGLAVIPGCVGPDSQGYITTPLGWAFSTQLLMAKNIKTENGRTVNDYGFVVLPKQLPLGATLGWLHIQALSTPDIRAETTFGCLIAGYPSDKKPIGSLWSDTPVLPDIDDDYVWYSAGSTEKGASGSPVLIAKKPPISPAGLGDEHDRTWVSFGIHTGNHPSDKTPPFRKTPVTNATRLTKEMVGIIEALIENPDEVPLGLTPSRVAIGYHVASAAPTELRLKVPSSEPPNSPPVPDWIESGIADLTARGGTLKIDNKNISKGADSGNCANRLAEAYSKGDKDFGTQLQAKLKEVIGESDNRKEINNNPLTLGKMPTRPVISIDTNVWWVDVDYQ
jgi:V8-like Glu-specific endopeptidase